MDRRQFVTASAMLSLVNAKAMAATCNNDSLSRIAYDELLRSVRPIAKSRHIKPEAIEFALTTLAELDTEQAIRGAILKLIDVASRSDPLVADIGNFVDDFNGPESALSVLRTQPAAFLDRPPVVELSRRLVTVMRNDANIFLLAANKLGTVSYLDYLPPNLPVSRELDGAAEAEEVAECASLALRVIADILVSIMAIIIAIATFGAFNSNVMASMVIAQLLRGVSVSARAGRNLADELDEVIGDAKGKIDEGIQERTRIYLGHAVGTATNCKSLLVRKDRAACLEASLLLCANAY
jgi:hypothetical protein